jgi:CBS domain-containing protein
LWWPPAKIVGRHLGPFLASLAGTGADREPPGGGALSVEVSLEPELISRLELHRLPVSDEEDEEPTIGRVSPEDMLIVAPEDTLGEIAERMLRDDLSAALVCEYGRLIGILTTHDLIGAFAARAHPSEARARQWMTAEPITLHAASSRASAARLMRAYGIRHIPLVEHGDRPVGLLHLDEEALAVVPIGLGF